MIDFFSDNLALHTITDRQAFNFTLEPRRMQSNEDVLNRGEQLRSEAQVGPQ